MLVSLTDLTEEQIIGKLRELRNNSLCDKSDFAVSALLRFELPNGRFATFAGVNVEMTGPNNNAMHAEQAAYVSAIANFGPNIRLTDVYVMGAMKNITEGTEHHDGNKFIQPCGHCRQILCQQNTLDAVIHSVSVNGAIDSKTYTLGESLKHAFTDDSLTVNGKKSGSNKQNPSNQHLFSNTGKTSPQSLSNANKPLTTHQAFDYLKNLKPLIINLKHEGNDSTTACLLKVTGGARYYTGVLVQEMGFQTTNPFNAAFAQKNTNEPRGAKSLIDQIHLYSPTDNEPTLSADNIATITPYITPSTSVYFYTKSGFSIRRSLEECIQLNANLLQNALDEQMKLLNHSPRLIS